jgi:hypothetical protein
LPRITRALSFGGRVSTARRFQHLVKVTVPVPTDATAHQALSTTPNTGLLHGATQVTTLPNNIIQRSQRPQLARQGPHDDDGLHTLSAQSTEYLHGSICVARERGVGQFIDVVTTAVRNDVINSFNTDFALAEYQAQLFDLLLRG